MPTVPLLPWPWEIPDVSIAHPWVTVRFHEVTVCCPSDEPARFASMLKAWQSGGDSSVFLEYEGLARSSRFGFSRTDDRPHGFVEAFTARLLEDERGFDCWKSAQLFNEAEDEERVRKTREVAARFTELGYPFPREVKTRYFLNHVRNPDLVGYRAESRELLFCEVKRWDDRIRNDRQVRGLALLHLITGAPISIVRLVQSAGPALSKLHEARFDQPGMTLMAKAMLQRRHPRE